MPVGLHIFALEAGSLLTWRLLLFPLLPFLFLLLLRGRLLALRRCWLGRGGRRRALLLLLALRRFCSLSRSWLVSVRLGTIVWLCRGRTIRLGAVIGLIRLGTIVWLCRGRTIRLGAVIGLIRLGTIVWLCRGRTIRLGAVIGLIRLGTIVWLCRGRSIRLGTVIGLLRLGTIVWLRRGRAIRLGAVIGLIRLGTIVWLCRRRTIRFGAIVRLRWSRLISRPVRRLVSGRIGGGLTRTPSIWLVRGLTRTFVRGWLISRPVRRLVSGLIGGGLSRTPSIRLVSRLIAWLVCRTAGIWCGRFARRRHLDHRLRSSCRTQRLHFMLRQRLSRMRCQCLLLFCKWHWGGRWCRLGDHRPVHHCRWRRGHMIRSRGLRSEYALPRRGNCYPRTHGCSGNLPRVHLDRRPGYRLRACEGALRNHRYRTLYIPVRIRHVCDGRAFIDDGGVVNVRDRGGIDSRIADVHPVHILPADLVRGHKNFPGTQRKPSHIAAEANSNSSPSTANKDHQRGSIYRLHLHGPGHPTPASSDRHPASIVEWRVAPRGVIDPRISPGRNPVPVTLVIRRPARFNMVGEPDVAVVRVVAPVAI